ncbi:hypothetical protein, partial [Pseudomonas lactis]|uniref:hypothetical protein n=1 Tax=Pseudomonas lactis TaxID=1615674 RepID=UPI001CA3FE87
QAEALSLTELNDGALFDAEFGIGHRGSTVPERSGVALSFRGRRALYSSVNRSVQLTQWVLRLPHWLFMRAPMSRSELNV